MATFGMSKMESINRLGMWVEHVGFFPITAPYPLPNIAWLPKVDPLFRVWTHANEKLYPNVHLLLNQSNNTTALPKNKSVPERNSGTFNIKLFDEFGITGHINYSVTSGASDRLPYSNLPSSLSGEHLLLMHLEQEESKIVSSIHLVHLDPQALLAIPL
jgi:hypothetical protein